MKNKILIFLFIGAIFSSILLCRPSIDTEIKPPDAPRTILKHKTNKYVPPTGKMLEIAQRVSTKTSIDVRIISRIMYFESSYNPTIINVNRNKTRDIGLFQINSIHLVETKNMGLNLKDPDDNSEFAIYLIKLNGLRDWKASEHNWKTSYLGAL